MRVFAKEEESWPRVGFLSWWEGYQLLHVLGQGIQVRPPHKAPICLYQVGEQELPHGNVLFGELTVRPGITTLTLTGPNLHLGAWGHHLDNMTELFVSQFAGMGVGHLVWDVYGSHGCYVG